MSKDKNTSSTTSSTADSTSSDSSKKKNIILKINQSFNNLLSKIGFTEWLNKNFNFLIKGLILYNFLLPTHAICAGEIYKFTIANSYNTDSLFLNFMSITLLGLLVSLSLILGLLTLKSDQYISFILIIGIFLSSVFTINSFVGASLVFFGDLYISYVLSKELSSLRGKLFTVGNLTITKEVAGIIGIFLAPILTFIATLITNS